MGVVTAINKYPLSTWMFCAMWVLTGFVSAYDVGLSVLNGSILYEIEQNPMAKYIIGEMGVPFFVAFKMLGTIVALGIVVLLFHNHRKMSWVVNSALFLTQMCLFVYLASYVV